MVIRDSENGRWLLFSSAVDVLVARRVDEVLPVLQTAERVVENDRLSAVGFVAYEAAPALDPALSVKTEEEFPLAWFAFFRRPRALGRLLARRDDRGPAPVWRSVISSEEYGEKLAAIREHLRNGDAYEVNFTHRLRATLCGDPWDHFVRFVVGRETPYAAYFDTGEWAVLSASPELFFRLDGEDIESRPMKGTAARGRWLEEDLRMAERLHESDKDRAENVMIVDMVRNDMGRVAKMGSVRASALFAVEKHPTVWQMTSTVRAKTAEPLTEIFRALFPPASITGAPKRRTMEIIKSLETSPRRVYTGAIGCVMPGRRALFNVAIRTAIVHRKTGAAEYGVGGGIVWDSEPDREWEECAVKARAIRGRQPEFDLVEAMLWSPGAGYALLEYHLRRLNGSAAYFGFDFDESHVREALGRAATPLQPVAHRVRLLMSRRGAVTVESRPISPDSVGFGAIGLATSAVDSADVFLFHKTTNRSVYDAALEACRGFDDVLLFNERGEITETTIANVAIEIDGTLWTPPVDCGLLGGTYRAWLLDRGRIREKTIRLEDVFQNPILYLMNAVRGLQKSSAVLSKACEGSRTGEPRERNVNRVADPSRSVWSEERRS